MSLDGRLSDEGRQGSLDDVQLTAENLAGEVMQALYAPEASCPPPGVNAWVWKVWLAGTVLNRYSRAQRQGLMTTAAQLLQHEYGGSWSRTRFQGALELAQECPEAGALPRGVTIRDLRCRHMIRALKPATGFNHLGVDGLRTRVVDAVLALVRGSEIHPIDWRLPWGLARVGNNRGGTMLIGAAVPANGQSLEEAMADTELRLREAYQSIGGKPRPTAFMAWVDQEGVIRVRRVIPADRGGQAPKWCAEVDAMARQRWRTPPPA